MNELMIFYEQIAKLKMLQRSGWGQVGVNANRIESVAEHIYSCGFVAMYIITKEKLNLNCGKVLQLILVHEICEIYCGDFTIQDGITKEQKHKLELDGARQFAKDVGINNFLDVWNEFEDGKTSEAIFARQMDKFDAICQAKLYSKTTGDDAIYKTFLKNGALLVGEYIKYFN